MLRQKMRQSDVVPEVGESPSPEKPKGKRRRKPKAPPNDPDAPDTQAETKGYVGLFQ